MELIGWKTWKNTGSKEMQCRCGGKADWRTAQVTGLIRQIQGRYRAQENRREKGLKPREHI